MPANHDDPCPRDAAAPTRRGVLAASAVLLAAAIRQAAAAEQGVPDVGVYCEPTLAPAIGAVGKLFRHQAGAPVAVLTAPADLILAQVRQNPADDLLILPAAAMDQAAARNFIDPSSRWDGLRNGLVLAMRAEGGASAASAGDLAALLASGRVAATDATAASTLDGVGLLGRLGVAGLLAGRIVGVPNTGDAAFMVRTGAARFGLMYVTDVRADPTLAVAAVLDPAIAAPVMFAAALNAKPRSRFAKPFLDFLKGPEAAPRLRQDGLEPV